ncbi:hypothetical protein [Persicobacter diffluens]|uniref:Uncharacterized protein n=1 Tax=Persicobacter diffluens TaxID=981 RepID=A0AAN4VY99_9BACT|nr:hypothetical protein PEDI_28230 [Persicobacter diffluens]
MKRNPLFQWCCLLCLLVIGGVEAQAQKERHRQWEDRSFLVRQISLNDKPMTSMGGEATLKGSIFTLKFDGSKPIIFIFDRKQVIGKDKDNMFFTGKDNQDRNVSGKMSNKIYPDLQGRYVDFNMDIKGGGHMRLIMDENMFVDLSDSTKTEDANYVNE